MTPNVEMLAAAVRGHGARRILRPAVLTLAVAMLAGCGLKAEEAALPPPPEVTAADVLVRDLPGWNEYTGRISAIETVQVRPRVSGYIDRVLFTEGAEVRKGTVLVEIDNRVFRAAVERARAELARAHSRAELAGNEVDRAQRLAQAQAISNELLDQRRSARVQAEADVRAAQAQLDLARLDLEFTRVRAPINGRAGRALVTAGNLATPDTTVLTTLVSLDPVHVDFEADERSFLGYQQTLREHGSETGPEGNTVRIGLADETGHPHAGVLDFLDNQVDPATGTIRARAVLDNRERRFTPGLFARVQLFDARTEPAILIDDKAVLTDQDRKYVYVLGEEGTAQRRDVALGRSVDNLRVITSGLVAGDRVIVGGVQKIFFPGMPVDARPVAMASGEALAAAGSR